MKNKPKSPLIESLIVALKEAEKLGIKQVDIAAVAGIRRETLYQIVKRGAANVQTLDAVFSAIEQLTKK